MAQATDLLFPQPREIQRKNGKVRWPGTLALRPGLFNPSPWLVHWLEQSAASAGVRLTSQGTAGIDLVLEPLAFKPQSDDPRIIAQSYQLDLASDGSVVIRASDPQGLTHGLITLAQLFRACAAGGSPTPLRIRDYPSFAVRGIQIDMAREYYPPIPYLKQIIDRCAQIKLNTLWLYLENHFLAPGMEDLSPRTGLTPAQARSLSAYAQERGIDLVPGTNLLSHMEGWLRLERYATLTDGTMRSYPVLTDPRAKKLVLPFVDALADAFPSPNFHAGLDELLFTGTNPAAQKAIDRLGKWRYYGRFARDLVKHLQARGKTVWIWDDMVVGKNIYRKEGFNDEYPKALEMIPRDVIFTHWYYWTDSDGKHGPIMKRVASCGRPFVVAGSSRSFMHEVSHLKETLENQAYMAHCGRRDGAFGYICTHWESRHGSAFAAQWPILAMSAGFAWQHDVGQDESLLRRLGFVLSGEVDGALGRYLRRFSLMQDWLMTWQAGHGRLRSDLFLKGPVGMWRMVSPLITAGRRRQLRSELHKARQDQQKVGHRDIAIRLGMEQPIILFECCLNLMDQMDKALGHYHRAALVERQSGKQALFRGHLRQCEAAIRTAIRTMAPLVRCLKQLETATGHTPYDRYALEQYLKQMNDLIALVRQVAADGNGLPNFEKLIYLPNAFHQSNLRQLQVQNTFYQAFPNPPWLGR